MKYDIIDEKTQNILTVAAWAGLAVHTSIAAFVATDCIQNSAADTKSQSATVQLAAVAAVRGFLVGFLELARVAALQTTRDGES